MFMCLKCGMLRIVNIQVNKFCLNCTLDLFVCREITLSSSALNLHVFLLVLSFVQLEILHFVYWPCSVKLVFTEIFRKKISEINYLVRVARQRYLTLHNNTIVMNLQKLCKEWHTFSLLTTGWCCLFMHVFMTRTLTWTSRACPYTLYTTPQH